MKVGDYVRSANPEEFPIPGTIIRSSGGYRYETLTTFGSKVTTHWSDKLPDMGKPFDPQLGRYVVEYIPSQESYAYNKVQRQILKWLRNLDGATDFVGKSTGSLMGQLAQFTVFHRSSEDATRKFFKQALNSLSLLDEGRLTEADLKKALKILGEKPKEISPFKVGDVYVGGERLVGLQPGSILDLNGHHRFILEDGQVWRDDDGGGRTMALSQYNCAGDRFTIRFINQ